VRIYDGHNGGHCTECDNSLDQGMCDGMGLGFYERIRWAAFALVSDVNPYIPWSEAWKVCVTGWTCGDAPSGANLRLCAGCLHIHASDPNCDAGRDFVGNSPRCRSV
jgi:hypothetical protein